MARKRKVGRPKRSKSKKSKKSVKKTGKKRVTRKTTSKKTRKKSSKKIAKKISKKVGKKRGRKRVAGTVNIKKLMSMPLEKLAKLQQGVYHAMQAKSKAEIAGPKKGRGRPKDHKGGPGGTLRMSAVHDTIPVSHTPTLQGGFKLPSKQELNLMKARAIRAAKVHAKRVASGAKTLVMGL